MITCKEDLMNTYIENDQGELREAYFSLIEELEVPVSIDGSYRGTFVAVLPSCNVVQSISTSINTLRGCKKLTLSDLKPRTRTEYEKVTESIFDLRDEFERGELYQKCSTFKVIGGIQELATCINVGNIYRKVEKEIDWTKDVMNFLRRELHDGGCVRNASIESLGGNFGCVNIDISFRHERFLELCRVALRANGELE